jgi:hypothetical protein
MPADDMDTSTDEWDVEDTRGRGRRYNVDGHKTAEFRYVCCKRVVVGYESDTVFKCPTHGDFPAMFVHSQ